MLKIEKKEARVPDVKEEAVAWYHAYFQNLLNSYTFQLRLNNDQVYYIFSTVPQAEWEELVRESRKTVHATRYLDNIQMECLFIHNIKSIRDVTPEVQKQYAEQRQVIFCSYDLVSKILAYKETKFVQDMTEIVMRSREDDESNRRYWRVLNEKYYGLDIHPLMEFEQAELAKILHYCQHPELQNKEKWIPVLKSGGVVSGVAVVGYVAYQLLL